MTGSRWPSWIAIHDGQLMVATGSFPASRLIGLAPGATARWSPECGRTEVGTHRLQISQRLVLHDVACMVRYAIRHDLVQPAL